MIIGAAKKAKAPPTVQDGGRVKISRKTKWGGHRYLAELDGVIVLDDGCGITTALNIIDKPGLKIAAARLAVERVQAISRRCDSVKMQGPDHSLSSAWAMIDEINEIKDGWKLVDEVWGGRAQRGTDAHALCEKVGIGFWETGRIPTNDEIARLCALEPVLDAPDVWLMVLAFRDWIARTRPVVLSTEEMAVCPDCGIGATLDLRCEIDGQPWVLDIKGAKDIYPSYALQTVFQAHAIEATLEDLSQPHAMGPAEAYRCGLLWISPNARDGCELVPVKNDDAAFKALMAALTLWRWNRAGEWRA